MAPPFAHNGHGHGGRSSLGKGDDVSFVPGMPNLGNSVPMFHEAHDGLGAAPAHRPPGLTSLRAKWGRAAPDASCAAPAVDDLAHFGNGFAAGTLSLSDLTADLTHHIADANASLPMVSGAGTGALRPRAQRPARLATDRPRPPLPSPCPQTSTLPRWTVRRPGDRPPCLAPSASISQQRVGGSVQRTDSARLDRFPYLRRWGRERGARCEGHHGWDWKCGGPLLPAPAPMLGRLRAVLTADGRPPPLEQAKRSCRTISRCPTSTSLRTSTSRRGQACREATAGFWRGEGRGAQQGWGGFVCVNIYGRPFCRKARKLGADRRGGVVRLPLSPVGVCSSADGGGIFPRPPFQLLPAAAEAVPGRYSRLPAVGGQQRHSHPTGGSSSSGAPPANSSRRAGSTTPQ